MCKKNNSVTLTLSCVDATAADGSGWEMGKLKSKKTIKLINEFMSVAVRLWQSPSRPWKVKNNEIHQPKFGTFGKCERNKKAINRKDPAEEENEDKTISVFHEAWWRKRKVIKNSDPEIN